MGTDVEIRMAGVWAEGFSGSRGGGVCVGGWVNVATRLMSVFPEIPHPNSVVVKFIPG